MPYSRTTWENSPSTATPLSATLLNNIEQGIVNLDSVISSLTTKGDLLVSGTSGPTRLAVGVTNGHVLTVDSAEATGLKWAAGGGGANADNDGGNGGDGGRAQIKVWVYG